MNNVILFVLGLLLGWLVEWVIDWFYWRHRYAGQETVLEAAKAAEAQARQQAAEAREQAAKLEERLIAAESVSFSVPDLAPEPPTIPNKPDDLTAIKGIGPVIAKKLNEAGISTYQQLSRLSSDEFEQILGDLIQRFVNERSILDQASNLAKQK